MSREKSTTSFSWRTITESKLFLPLLVLALILLFDFIAIPGFMTIESKGGDLYGRLIHILRNGSTVMILALGMTLVIATGGVDLSVGAVMAVAASVAALMMNPFVLAEELPPHLLSMMQDPYFTYSPLWLVITVTLLVSILCGLWNGILVAYWKIEPMVATLVLMIAGRGIAQLITNAVRIQIFYQPYAFIGQGWLILPFSFYIIAVVYLLSWLLVRKTALGLFVSSVGINHHSSYFSGIDEKKIKLMAYAFCGFCAGIAGLIASSDIQTSDANNIGLYLELDAILAVVIGGTLLGAGGRFNLLASIFGALVMQATTTSMYALGVPANAVIAIKGMVVVIVILLYSKQVQGFIRRIGGRQRTAA